MVYLAQTETGQLVAIKVIDKKVIGSDLTRVYKEIEIPALLGCSHKNVICVLDSYQTEKYIYIVSEYVKGGYPLTNYLTVKVDVKLLDILYQIADGLEALHKHNVIHRDLKLGNIILKDTVPVIIDFDLSCMLDYPRFPCKGIVGSPMYIAPEVWSNKITDYFKTDIFSLGVVYYMMSNKQRRPFPGDTVNKIRTQITSGKVLPSSSGNLNLDELINRMLMTDPKARPSLPEIKNTLQELIKTL